MARPSTIRFAHVVASFFVGLVLVNRKHVCCGAPQQTEETEFLAKGVLTQNFRNENTVSAKQNNEPGENLEKSPLGVDSNNFKLRRNATVRGIPSEDGEILRNHTQLPPTEDKIVRDNDDKEDEIDPDTGDNETNPISSAREPLATKVQNHLYVVDKAGRLVQRNLSATTPSQEDMIADAKNVSTKDKDVVSNTGDGNLINNENNLPEDEDNLDKIKDNLAQDENDLFEDENKVEEESLAAKDRNTLVQGEENGDAVNHTLAKAENNTVDHEDGFEDIVDNPAEEEEEEEDTFLRFLGGALLFGVRRTPQNDTESSAYLSGVGGAVQKDRCLVDIAASRLALVNIKADWARAMADSTGHFGAGGMSMEMDLVGVQDECLEAVVPDSKGFQTQYCVVSFELGKVHLSEAMKFTLPTGLSAGACLPDSCAEAEVKDIANKFLSTAEGTLGGIRAKEVFCKKQDDAFAGPGAVATMVLLSLWGSAVVLATIVDGWFAGSEEENLLQQHPELAEQPGGSGQPEEEGEEHRGSYTSSSTPPQSESSPKEEGKAESAGVAAAAAAVAAVSYSRSQERDSTFVSTSETEQLTIADGDSDVVVIPEIAPQPSDYRSAKRLPFGKRGRRIRGILSGKLSNSAMLKSDEVSRKTMELGRFKRLARCFSLKANAEKLFDTSTSRKEIGCLHGIRVISLAWVVLINSMVYEILFTRNAFNTFREWQKHGSRYSFLAKGYLSLDSLFALSGLLTGYTYSMKLSKQWGKMNWLLYLFNRYWRIVPTMLVVGLAYLGLFAYVTRGPLAVNSAPDQDACIKWGWLHVFLLQNFAPAPCMSWTWYLAVDFQLYLLTPFLLWLLYRDARVAYLATFILVLASCFANGAVSRAYHLTVTQFILPDLDNVTSVTNTFDAETYSSVYLTKPWAHAGAFFPPLMVGYLLYRSNRRARFGTRALVAGWAAAAAVPLSILIGVRSELTRAGTFSAGTLAFYNAVHRTAWGLSVSWTVLACSTGHGGPVNSFLAWPGWKPFSRLGFVAYLVHPAVTQVYGSNMEQLMYATTYMATYHYIAVFVCSLMLSALISLTVEMPLAALFLWMSSSRWPGQST